MPAWPDQKRYTSREHKLRFWTRFAGCDAKREEKPWVFHGDDEQRSSALAKLGTKTQFMPARGINEHSSQMQQ